MAIISDVSQKSPMIPRGTGTLLYHLRGAIVGEEGGESGSGIRLAYSTSIIRIRSCMIRPPAAVHAGPTPGC
jgi:hypothetical protein